MSKYQPLENYLKNIKHDQIDIKFAEIEQLLGFHLPASSRDHRAWWSNNSSNNVMTHAWVNAGCVTESVDMALLPKHLTILFFYFQNFIFFLNYAFL